MDKLIIIGTPNQHSPSYCKNCDRMYLAKDYSSGGYPYWTDSVNSAEQFNSVDAASNFLKFADYIFRSADNIQVATLEYVVTPIKGLSLDLERYTTMIAKDEALLKTASDNLNKAAVIGNMVDVCTYLAEIERLAKQIQQNKVIVGKHG